MEQIAKFRMKAVLENVPRAMACVREAAQRAGFSERTLHQIELAVDEACANVVHHAYRDMEPGDMEVSCHLGDKKFVMRVRNWGRSFEPEDVPKPDVDAPLEERSLGGLGLFLIRKFMDEVRFSFDPEEGNELTMVKRLPRGE